MKTKSLVLISLFAAVTAVFSQFTLPNPFSPVPVSLSLIAVCLCGALLSPKQALTAQAVYILLGAVGLPVFSHFSGGFAALAGPTGGYIAAYPLMAFLIAFVSRKLSRNPTLGLAVGMLGALAVCYALGSAWLGAVMRVNFLQALVLGAVPFIAVDLLKITVSIGLARALRRFIKIQST